MNPDPYAPRFFLDMAEKAVLGAMLLDADAALKAAELLDEATFSSEAHRALFGAMVALSERGVPIDLVTLCDELDRRGEYEAVGGLKYIGALVDVVATADNVEYHARIVRERAGPRPC